MATASRELEAVAAAVARVRSASGPVARMQAVQAAARAMQGLSSTDREVLARGLIEHGAPTAGEVIARHAGGAVDAEQLVSLTQGLLALDPGEAERFAAELRDPHQGARVAADVPRSTRDPSPAPGPPPVPVVASSRPRETDPPPSRAGTLESTLDEHATPSHPVATREADRPPRAEERSVLAAALWSARDARSRFSLLEDVPRMRGVLEAGGAAELLDAVPDGWQRRTVLRRLLDAAGRAAVADGPSTVVASFARRGDRFAAASLLQRRGCAHPDELEGLLDHRDRDRLRARDARAAAGRAGGGSMASSTTTGRP